MAADGQLPIAKERPMNKIRRRLPTPAMLVACIALAVSLGGVSYAAGALPKGSVGTAQLKKKAVTGAKLQKNAVTGIAVKNRTLTAADFKAGALPAGTQGQKGDPGAQGPKGEKGDTGPAGVSGLEIILGPETTVNPGTNAPASATCPAGKQATGGGGGSEEKMAITNSGPVGTSTWTVHIWNSTASPQVISAYAVCATVG
jgi:hypothetical protein